VSTANAAIPKGGSVVSGSIRVLVRPAEQIVSHVMCKAERINRGSPRTDKMIAAAVQWAERIMQKVDSVYSDEKPKSVAQKA
jgi:hypothetical protein